MGGGAIVGSPPVYTVGSLLVVEAVTNLHVGVGRGGGTVDLPVQRDEHGFPTIYASSLKGALKTAVIWAHLKTYKDYDKALRMANILFGPDPQPEEAFESSVAILDAVLAAIPARSLKGVYAYVTSPYLVGRVLDYVKLYMKLASSQLNPDLAQRLSKLVSDLTQVSSELKDDGCVCVGNCDVVKVKNLDDRVVLMEEFWLDCKKGHVGDGEENLLTPGDEPKKPLLILGDDVAREVVNRALIKMARVRIERETKTVKTGGLWSEEYVPARSRFVTVALFKRPPVSKLLKDLVKPSNEKQGEAKSNDEKQEKPNDEGFNDKKYLEALKKLGFVVKEETAEGVARSVKDMFLGLLKELNHYIIVGGHETIGKGIVRITPL
ncbi:MAG: type III-B CRISPR module RAMP protein Cmr4 [Pyrobaculum sp.]